MPKLLLIDDDLEILHAMKRYFEAIGYMVFAAANGAEAIAYVSCQTFDCIVLDVMLPDQDGYHVCETIRLKSKTPIIFLSCRDEVEDKIMGLTAGGDDYITKPFELTELEARIHAQIRRDAKFGFSVDVDNRTIVTGGRCLALPQKEFEILMLLYENEGTHFTAAEICRLLWNDGMINEANNVAVHIKHLRDKLANLSVDLGEIQSAYKRGYKFIKK